jgi:hypothetical protein
VNEAQCDIFADEEGVKDSKDDNESKDQNEVLIEKEFKNQLD